MKPRETDMQQARLWHLEGSRWQRLTRDDATNSHMRLGRCANIVTQTHRRVSNVWGHGGRRCVRAQHLRSRPSIASKILFKSKHIC